MAEQSLNFDIATKPSSSNLFENVPAIGEDELESILKGVRDNISKENDETTVEIKLIHCLDCNLSLIEPIGFFSHLSHKCFEDCKPICYCDECKTVLFQDDDLKIHMETHTSPVCFLHCLNRCHFCDGCKKIEKKCLLSKYLKMFSEAFLDGSQFCEFCGMNLRGEKMGDHVLMHTGAKEFCCEVCFKEFSLIEELIEHKCGHFLRICKCGDKLASVPSYLEHLRSNSDHTSNEHKMFVVNLFGISEATTDLDSKEFGENMTKVVICSENCEDKLCYKRTQSDLKDIRGSISALSKSELHNFLLGRLKLQREIGFGCVGSFRLGKFDFCENGLHDRLGISKYMISTVIKEYSKDQEIHVHGNKGLMYDSHKKDRAISFITHFAQVHSENLPDRSCLRLPSYLTVKAVYNHYCEGVTDSERVAERTFYNIFQKCFSEPNRNLQFLPRVTFLAAHTHPVCNECAVISDLRKSAKSESDGVYAESRKRSHMLDIRRRFLKFTYRRELTVRYPASYLHINLDDMDQAKLLSPFTLRNTKQTSGMLRLNNHMTGVMVHNGSFANDHINMLYF